MHSIASSLPAGDTVISCLCRDPDKAQQVKDHYPDHVQTVVGDLDDDELIESQSQQADIVFRELAPYSHSKRVRRLTNVLLQILLARITWQAPRRSPGASARRPTVSFVSISPNQILPTDEGRSILDTDVRCYIACYPGDPRGTIRRTFRRSL